MKEYKFVNAMEGQKAIQIGKNAVSLEENCNILIEKYASEGWELFQFVPVMADLLQIVFVRDKQ